MVTGPPASAVTMRPAGLSKTVAASVFSVRPDISGISSATDRKASAAQASPMKIFTFQWLARNLASNRIRKGVDEEKELDIRYEYGGRRYNKNKNIKI